ncbi:hypothetical protein O0L34_g11402 [Tuta absoluta]|nr:hypothetical protein O0L34_g11402 [Tuta absoluta]
MEEILDKNIFDEKDLKKLSPDFVPKNVLLRMQVRSAMVKDTHLHPEFKNNLQRKTMKPLKDSNKNGKEIAKIKNKFQSINLKNQIMLKNAVKSVDTLKSEHFINGFNDELETLATDEEGYLKNICSMNLTLQNDATFKLKDKPYKDLKNNIKQDHKKNVTSEDPAKDDEENVFEDVLRVECTLVEPISVDVDKVDDTVSNEKTDKHDDVKQSDAMVETSTREGIEMEVINLQSLLTMLTISPLTENDEKSGDAPFPISNSRSNDNNALGVNFNNFDTANGNNKEGNGEVYDFLNIVPMRVEINERQKVLMMKYVAKWKAHVVTKKQIIAQQREHTLHLFFEKLTKRKASGSDTSGTPVNKAKTLARDYNRYRHRFQMQKHIIALQKAKLEEQNRIIEELKYNRIVEASKFSIDAMKEEVRKTYYDMDRQLKPKIKSLTGELKLEIEEPSLVLHCLKVPQFLQRMEKRAREREEKHAMIRERRQQMEEERIRIKQQDELAKAQMDKNEKIKRMNELKEKRKREKIENIRKKQHAERIRALNVMAELHYEKNLKAKYGIRPFRILIEMKSDNIEKAKAHYKFQLKKNVFLNWMWYTEDMWYERNFKAEDFFKKKILRQAFDCFKKVHYNFVIKKQVADDYYDLFVMNVVFRKFRTAIELVKQENEMKLQMATMYHNSNLLFRTFCCWRSLPALNALKREQEVRKARWREKVLQVVPDYTPPED